MTTLLARIRVVVHTRMAILMAILMLVAVAAPSSAQQRNPDGTQSDCERD
jgi:hypothetical protein